jgi:3D (Asp-Asp-Asp) domain-containing protein
MLAMRAAVLLGVGLAIWTGAAGCGSDAAGSDATGGSSGLAGSGAPGGGGTPGNAGTGGVSSGGSAGADASLGGEAGSGGGTEDASAPAPGPALGTFKLTYYWVTTEEEFTGAKDTNLYDPSCKLLATVTAKFAASLKLEGTGRLLDGRILNYSGACSCPTSPCYIVADAAHPWGYGVKGWALVPFRSFAVDSSEIAYGSSLYVPALDGVTMPGDAPWGDFVHDGCVSADDTGGSIIGKHVDWFVALKAHYLTLNGALGLSSLTVHEGGARCP